MDKELKDHVKILADKFHHKVEYQKDVMILENQINHIKVWGKDKYGINISYNLNENQSANVKIENDDVYDVIIELLNRKEHNEKLKRKTGILITIEEWITEEGEFAKEQLEKLKIDLQYQQIKFRALGGNRFEAEYNNGILILTDDLCWAKSNVIPI